MVTDRQKIAAGVIGLPIVATIIGVLASIKTAGRDDQLVIHHLDGKRVYNGPLTMVAPPFRSVETRKVIRLTVHEYVRVRNTLNGSVRMVSGAQRFFLDAYEEAGEKTRKTVLRQNQYARLVDRLTGAERIVPGPTSIVPGSWEEIKGGVQQAAFVTRESALVILNRATGQKRLHTRSGALIPDAYEDVLETLSRIQVLPHEAMVVRSTGGQYVIHSGAGINGSGTGLAFFLAPFEEVVSFSWSVFSQPPEGERQAISQQRYTRIDMRVRKVFYQYDVRTVDNVALLVEGSIFWKINDMAKLVNKTGDPTGDVWYKARSTLVSAVSKVTFETFMRSFNPLIRQAFADQQGDPFWSERGVEVRSMEVTKYECTDDVVAATLQAIIEETTNRINRLQAQRAESDVQEAALKADIALERERATLLSSQARNQILLAQREGEAEGVQLANSVSTFLDGLVDALPNVSQRVRLFKMHEEIDHQERRAHHISGSKATLFFSPENLGITFNSRQNFESVEL